MSKQPHIAFVWPPVLFLDCDVYMNPYTYQTSYNCTPIKVHFTVCCFMGAFIFFFFVEGNAICVYPVFIFLQHTVRLCICARPLTKRFPDAKCEQNLKGTRDLEKLPLPGSSTWQSGQP